MLTTESSPSVPDLLVLGLTMIYVCNLLCLALPTGSASFAARSERKGRNGPCTVCSALRYSPSARRGDTEPLRRVPSRYTVSMDHAVELAREIVRTRHIHAGLSRATLLINYPNGYDWVEF